MEETAILKLVSKLNLGMVYYKAMFREEGSRVTVKTIIERSVLFCFVYLGLLGWISGSGLMS